MAVATAEFEVVGPGASASPLHARRWPSALYALDLIAWCATAGPPTHVQVLEHTALYGVPHDPTGTFVGNKVGGAAWSDTARDVQARMHGAAHPPVSTPPPSPHPMPPHPTPNPSQDYTSIRGDVTLFEPQLERLQRLFDVRTPGGRGEGLTAGREL